MALRHGLYRSGVLRSWHPGVPVVVVGNVVAGGAGKTPVVMALVRHLQATGWRPGVISRGYGRRSRGCREVQPDMDAADCGDEPLLIRQRCAVPVFVAERRAEAAQALRQAHPDVNILVSDDGLQHHALGRDINIAVFDDRGLGNGWLLPAGPLRERWRGQARGGIDLVLHTGSQPAFAGHRSSRKLAGSGLSPSGHPVALDALRGQRLVAVAGIAQPQAFFDMLGSLGLDLAQTQALPDHDDLAGFCLPADEATTVLCTEKDAVKLFPRHAQAGDRLLAVPLEFTPAADFFAALDALLVRHRPGAGHPLPSPHGHTTS